MQACRKLTIYEGEMRSRSSSFSRRNLTLAPNGDVIYDYLQPRSGKACPRIRGCGLPLRLADVGCPQRRSRRVPPPESHSRADRPRLAADAVRGGGRSGAPANSRASDRGSRKGYPDRTLELGGARRCRDNSRPIRSSRISTESNFVSDNNCSNSILV